MRHDLHPEGATNMWIRAGSTPLLRRRKSGYGTSVNTARSLESTGSSAYAEER